MPGSKFAEQLQIAGTVGQVHHADYADYITTITRRTRVDGRWASTEHPYMSVDGRIKMAVDDHARQGGQLNFLEPRVLVNDSESLTLLVTVESSIYGRRHGIATSRKADGAPIEQQHPWEIAETSAIGRALATFGYGLLPGAGLASAEDIERAQARPQRQGQGEARSSRDTKSAPATGPRLSQKQLTYVVEGYGRTHNLSAGPARRALDDYCQVTYGHRLAECTVEEGRELIAQLRSEDGLPSRQAATQPPAGGGRRGA